MFWDEIGKTEVFVVILTSVLYTYVDRLSSFRYNDPCLFCYTSSIYLCLIKISLTKSQSIKCFLRQLFVIYHLIVISQTL